MWAPRRAPLSLAAAWPPDLPPEPAWWTRRISAEHRACATSLSRLHRRLMGRLTPCPNHAVPRRCAHLAAGFAHSYWKAFGLLPLSTRRACAASRGFDARVLDDELKRCVAE